MYPNLFTDFDFHAENVLSAFIGGRHALQHIDGCLKELMLLASVGKPLRSAVSAAGACRQSLSGRITDDLQALQRNSGAS